jgi:hypothetical protein
VNYRDRSFQQSQKKPISLSFNNYPLSIILAAKATVNGLIEEGQRCANLHPLENCFKYSLQNLVAKKP